MFKGGFNMKSFKDISKELSTAVQSLPNIVKVLVEGLAEVEAGASYKKDALYVNEGSGNPAAAITLAHDMTDYDVIYLVGHRAADASFILCTSYIKESIAVNKKIGLNDDTMYLWFEVTAANKLTISGTSTQAIIDGVYGVKY